MKILAASMISVVLMAYLTGCSTVMPAPKAYVVDASYSAADGLIYGTERTLDRKKPLIAATFVNVDNLEQATSFGRTVSRQVASRFTQRGWGIIEMLFRHNVFIKKNSGEFALSQELRDISSQHDAQAVIVGTYSIGRDTVYVTARIIRAVDSIILASIDYTLPIDRNIAFLLRQDLGQKNAQSWLRK
jgi:TolB-like protein